MGYAFSYLSMKGLQKPLTEPQLGLINEERPQMAMQEIPTQKKREKRKKQIKKEKSFPF